MRTRTFCIIVCGLLSGCVPTEYVITPHLVGMVKNEKTHRPVAGALLYYLDRPEKTVRTTSNGKYEFPVVKTWGPGPPFDAIIKDSTLVVEASGYKTLQRPTGWRCATDPCVVNLSLEPLTQ